MPQKKSCFSSRGFGFVAAICAATALFGVLEGCNPVDFVKKLDPTPTTAYERYASSLRSAGLDSTAIGRDWLLASDSALRSPLVATLPLNEVGVYRRSEARAVAYQVRLREGQRIIVSVRSVGLPAQLYLDVFEVSSDSIVQFRHRATSDSTTSSTDGSTVKWLNFEPPRSAMYILRFQPELLRDGKFELHAIAEPVLAFPVEGGDNKSIQSFYGAERDGGSREHRGVDIFARRGTPALAVTDGVVRSISPNNLGGNVVWLADVKRSQSIYYAHLDSQNVVAGQVVRVGDTVGFVGNTGNARTTSPHLHFGIYRRGSGAIDPLAFIRRVDMHLPKLAVDTTRLGAQGSTRSKSTTLTVGPLPGDSVVTRLDYATELVVMAANGAKFRVQLDNGVTGYLPAASFRTISQTTENH